MLRIAAFLLASWVASAGIVNDVRDAIARGDFALADRQVAAYRASRGGTTELAAAVSWLARGALAAHQLDRADAYAEEARTLATGLLAGRKLEDDPWLPVALGASIEVHAQVLAARGDTGAALAFLRQQLPAYRGSPLAERIQKNINLLNLEGKPAPPLDASDWLGLKPPPLASLRCHPVLLFFWAHWCPDCKALAPVLARIRDTYAREGLVLIAPTKNYGFVAGGQEAPPNVEKQYIDQVRQHYYPVLSGVPVPLGAANFEAYGSSTTPTVVLIDASGIVRLYHPGAMPETELDAQVRRILKKPAGCP